MTGPPLGPSVPSVIEGLSTVEVRWILPGQLDAAVAGWFGRFPAGLDSREDAYLVHPVLRGLAVKIRAGLRILPSSSGAIGMIRTHWLRRREPAPSAAHPRKGETTRYLAR